MKWLYRYHTPEPQTIQIVYPNGGHAAYPGEFWDHLPREGELIVDTDLNDARRTWRVRAVVYQVDAIPSLVRCFVEDATGALSDDGWFLT